MINMDNKNIVLFGNAKSVLNKKRQIDNKFDIICRINAGIPKDKEQYIGSRTDILFLSLDLSEKDILAFNTGTIIICSPLIFLDYINCRYSYSAWCELYSKLSSRPSTGLMAFDYILQRNFKTLTLLGFDFWQTSNWYTNNIHIAKHNPKAERLYIEQKIEEYKDKIILEK